jgi:hypothetical protein
MKKVVLFFIVFVGARELHAAGKEESKEERKKNPVLAFHTDFSGPLEDFDNILEKSLTKFDASTSKLTQNMGQPIKKLKTIVRNDLVRWTKIAGVATIGTLTTYAGVHEGLQGKYFQGLLVSLLGGGALIKSDKIVDATEKLDCVIM